MSGWVAGQPAPLFAPLPYMPTDPPPPTGGTHVLRHPNPLAENLHGSIIRAKNVFFCAREWSIGLCGNEWMNNAHAQMLLKHVCESIRNKNRVSQK